MNVNIKSQLADVLDVDTAFDAVWSKLRWLKEQGLSADEVRIALESLRTEVTSEGAEDRILDALDCVTGFCSPDKKIWDD
ncbi:MAG TPA: hypothetical protein VND64_31735 [Pirellulales bacterium]|nr:hypothetical protein [Pirellulales bacterium]